MMHDDYVKRSDVHKAFQPKYAPAINRTFATMIDSVPAADVVEVVRCRECGYHYKTYSGWFCSHGVFVNDAVPPDDFYCADGKRKDGGQDE